MKSSLQKMIFPRFRAKREGGWLGLDSELGCLWSSQGTLHFHPTQGYVRASAQHSPWDAPVTLTSWYSCSDVISYFWLLGWASSLINKLQQEWRDVTAVIRLLTHCGFSLRPLLYSPACPLVVGRRGRHGRELKLKKIGHEKGHIAPRIK
jgi:hypothetical protein